MGIDTDRVYRLAWSIGLVCVGIAGVLMSAALLGLTRTRPGSSFVLLAYVVVVLGGLGDMIGALLGSLIVAGVEVLGSYYLGSAVEGSHLLRALHRGPRVPPRRPLRPARVRDAGGLALEARRPRPRPLRPGRRWPRLVTRDGFLLDSLILILPVGARCRAPGTWAGGLRGPGLPRPLRVLFGLGRLLGGPARHPVEPVAVARAAGWARCSPPWAGLVIGYPREPAQGPLLSASPTIAFSPGSPDPGPAAGARSPTGSEGIPGAVPPWVRHSRLPVPRSRGVYLVLTLAVGIYLVARYPRDLAPRATSLAGVREDEDAAEGARHPRAAVSRFAAVAGERPRAHLGVRGGALGPVRGLRGSLLRLLLGRPLGALRAEQHHRRARHPRSGPFVGSLLITLAGDLPARDLQRFHSRRGSSAST